MFYPSGFTVMLQQSDSMNKTALSGIALRFYGNRGFGGRLEISYKFLCKLAFHRVMIFLWILLRKLFSAFVYETEDYFK